MCCDFVLFEILRYVHAEWSKSVLMAQILNSRVFWTPKIYGSTLVPNAFIFGIFGDTFLLSTARWWWIACAKQETDKTMISMRWSTWNSCSNWFNPRGVHLINCLHLLPFQDGMCWMTLTKWKTRCLSSRLSYSWRTSALFPQLCQRLLFRENRKRCA